MGFWQTNQKFDNSLITALFSVFITYFVVINTLFFISRHDQSYRVY